MLFYNAKIALFCDIIKHSPMFLHSPPAKPLNSLKIVVVAVVFFFTTSSFLFFSSLSLSLCARDIVTLIV